MGWVNPSRAPRLKGFLAFIKATVHAFLYHMCSIQRSLTG